ncbi:hypothetical protein MMC13_001082 [Lambiella insularis]|nr:hypothetical protein [Lambiella insularis]
MSGHGGPHGVYQPIPDAETEDGFDDHHETQHAANEVLTHQRTRLVIICGAYNSLIQKIHSQVHEYSDDYAFLETYVYDLGADQLTTFGGQELVNLGTSFYNRYQNLARKSTPFVRASGQERVVQSAQKFTQGFHGALVKDGMSSNQDHYPYSITTINEGEGNNNTLSHGSCTKFEAGHGHDIGWEAQKQWLQIFATPITARLNKELSGANLTAAETIHFMDLCPFETVASPTGQISPFCNLFSEEEWRQYDYYQSLGKFYGYGSGNPLGPTQGVGFANELIARMTNKPVEDHTSVNHSMDHSDATFPLGRTIYADFTHDKCRLNYDIWCTSLLGKPTDTVLAGRFLSLQGLTLKEWNVRVLKKNWSAS